MTNRSHRPAFVLTAVVLATVMILSIHGCSEDTTQPTRDVIVVGLYIGDFANEPNFPPELQGPRRNFIAPVNGSHQDYFLIGDPVEALEAVFQEEGGGSVPARIEGVDKGNRLIVNGVQSIELELISYDLVQR